MVSTDPALPPELLGLLTIIVIPVQLLLIAVCMVGFNQAWNVEEERPIGGRHPDDDGPPPPPVPDKQTPPARPPEDETLVDDPPPPPPPQSAGESPAYAREDDDGEWGDGGQHVSPAI